MLPTTQNHDCQNLIPPPGQSSATGRFARLLLTGLLIGIPGFAFAGATPLWDLSKNAILPGLSSGKVEMADGKVALRDGAAFAIPAEAFPDQKNFTVQVTLSVNELPGKAMFTFLNKQTAKDDGFDYSILNLREKPGNYFIDSSVNKILMESWLPLGNKWPELNVPTTFILAVRNGLATFYNGEWPVKSCLMEIQPNAEPMWIGRNTDPQAKHLPVTIHDVKVYGPDYKFVSKIEEGRTRRTIAGKGWAIDAPKKIEHPEWPKVLIFGDSISGGYGPLLQAELEKRQINFFHFMGFVGGEANEQVFIDAGSSYKYDVIVFNNGLHSLSWTPEAVSDAVVSERMRKIAQGFKKGAPQAKLFYLSTTPHTGLRPAPDKPVRSLGDKNDVVIRLNTLSAQVMKEENIEWIDVYTLLAAKLELANGDKFHWQKPAYEIISQEVAKRVLPLVIKSRPTELPPNGYDARIKGREILTPKASPVPEINGARIFGARPGSPFLFKVAASGEAPKTYSASALPTGLSIDPKNGVITGTVKQAGDYRVDLIVSNAWGKAAGSLKIAIGDNLLLTPPMGWNSWYHQSESVSDRGIRAMADALVQFGMINYGWTYVNIDDCWQGDRGGPLNALQPNDRFPDMKELCAYLHSFGLKAGIYHTPMIGTYAGFNGGSSDSAEGDNSACYLPEDQRRQKPQYYGRYPGVIKLNLLRPGKYSFTGRDARQWAEWGFDYVKLDFPAVLQKPELCQSFLQELKSSGRDIAFSLSNDTRFDYASGSNGLATLCNVWRTGGDISAQWENSVKPIIMVQKKWAALMSQGHWNDPDMLQVGNLGHANKANTTYSPTPLTPDEQYTQVSFWSLISAPLLLSCDLPTMDEFTLGLLTNPEVIAVDQDSAANAPVFYTFDWQTVVMSKKMSDGSQVVGLFNLDHGDPVLTVTADQLGITGKLRDLWRRKDIGVMGQELTVKVGSHGCALIKVTP